MISENEIREEINKNSSWRSIVHQYGSATWVDISIPGEFVFSIQITPSEGIGVTNRTKDNADLDLGGHDEVFTEFSEALGYIKSTIKTKQL